jgi:hypothetical protein
MARINPLCTRLEQTDIAAEPLEAENFGTVNWRLHRCHRRAGCEELIPFGQLDRSDGFGHAVGAGPLCDIRQAGVIERAQQRGV